MDGENAKRSTAVMSKEYFHFTLSSFWIISALIVSPASAQEIFGEAGKVVDGDTLAVR
jgi:hypothetical protein